MTHQYDDEEESMETVTGQATKERIFFAGGIVFILLFLMIVMFCLSSCTLSFQNISTHGTATDLVDEDQTTDPTVTPTTTLSIPAMGL